MGGGEKNEQERAFLLKQALREELNNPIHGDNVKKWFKEGLTEWLDGKWAELGKWTWRGIAASAFGGLLYLWAKTKGLM